MNKRVLLAVAAVAAVAVLLIIGVTTAFFTDVDVKDNQITIGNVSITLSEGGFDPTVTYEVVPGTRIEKAPKLKNTGNKDEFVFMRITVPKDSVTLLSESGADKGTPIDGLSGNQQLFRLLSDVPTPDTTAAVSAVTGRDVDFTYHSATAAGGSTVDGWVLLGSNTSGAAYDEYVFGYNKKMSPNDETVTLFDDVQLKSFIDGEVTGNKEIGVYCYGIQAEYLKTDPSLDLDAAHFTDTELNNIYTIVKNKAGLT